MIAKRSEDAQVILSGIDLLIRVGANLTQQEKDDLRDLRDALAKMLFRQIFIDSKDLGVP